MGDAPEEPEADAVKTAEPEAEPTLEADEPAKADAEAEKPPEPEPPGDPKKEWPLALGIMVAIATICWAFLTLLRAP